MGKRKGRPSQGTCMKVPWAWTTGWGFTVGVGGGWGRGEQWGKVGITIIEQQLKKEKNFMDHTHVGYLLL